MKWSIAIIVLFLTACQSDKIKRTSYYTATVENKTALVKITEFEDRFYGTFQVRYGYNAKDEGTIRGERIGDTLKGRFEYLSFGGNKKITPFILLKSNEKFKMGSGIVATMFNIPFFLPETLQFKNDDFLFKKIDSKKAQRIKSEIMDQ
jgi:hypothetical protein